MQLHGFEAMNAKGQVSAEMDIFINIVPRAYDTKGRLRKRFEMASAMETK